MAIEQSPGFTASLDFGPEVTPPIEDRELQYADASGKLPSSLPIDDKIIPGLDKLPPNMGVAGQYLASNGGYAPHQIAGILGVLAQESTNKQTGDLDPYAVNPSSGALGLPQFLDRRPAFEQWLRQSGNHLGDPTAHAQYMLNELASSENASDKALRAAKTPAEAVMAMRGYERGGNYGNRDLASANQIHNLMLAASKSKQGQPASPWDALGKQLQAQGITPQPPDLAKTPIPQSTDPMTNAWAKVGVQIDNRLKTGDPAGIADRYPVPPQPESVSAVGHFFSWLPQASARGLAEQVGMPIDTLNSAANFYAHNPAAIGGLDSGGPPIDWTGSQTTGGAMPANETMPAIPGGTDTVRHLMGSIGIPTATPAEMGDHSKSAQWASMMGQVFGGASPFSAASLVRTGGKVAATEAARVAAEQAGGIAATGGGVMPYMAPLAKTAGKDAAMLTFSGVLGKELADSAFGPPGSEGVKGAAGVALAPAVVVAIKALASAGLSITGHSSNPIFSQIFNGNMNASGMLRSMSDDPAAASANVKGARSSLSVDLPEGFQVPNGTASQDAALQTLQQSLQAKNAKLDQTIRGQVVNNENILAGQANLTGDELENANNWVAKSQNDQLAAKQGLIDNAVENAKRDRAAAEKGANLTPESAKFLDETAMDNLRQHLKDAWANASAYTQAQFASVAQGLRGLNVPMNRFYDRMSAMMAEASNAGLKTSFPEKVIADLYKDGKPLNMFDNAGIVKGTPAENYLGGTAPWQRMQGLYNNIDNEISNIIKAGGDPVKAQYLMRIQQEVLETMKDFRLSSGAFAKQGTLPADLDLAIKSAQENRRLFIDSPVGQVLGMNKNGMPMQNAEVDIRRWLGNSPETVNKVQSMYDAVAQQPNVLGAGRHPADAMKQEMDGWLRQQFADAFRSGGSAKAQQWLETNSGVLQHQGFRATKAEFEAAVKSGSFAEELGGNKSAPQLELDRLRKNSLQQFMDNEPEQKLDVLFRTGRQGPSTQRTNAQEILEALGKDPTGRATEGMGELAMQRLIVEAKAPNPGNIPGKQFSSAAADNFYANNKPVFDEIGKSIPGFDQRVQQQLNGFRTVDKIMSNPGVTLNRSELDFSATGLARIMAQVAAARLGRDLHTGTIQVPGIFSRLGGGLVDKLMSNIPNNRAADLLAKAMVDPETFQQLMMPLRGNEHAYNLFLEPYIQAAPGIVKGTYDEYNSPDVQQRPPPTRLDGKIIVPGQLTGPRQPNAR